MTQGAQSERERVITDLLHKFGCPLRRVEAEEVCKLLWDAAIDAAAKCAFNDEPELDILALKGDRNVEQSGTVEG